MYLSVVSRWPLKVFKKVSWGSKLTLPLVLLLTNNGAVSALNKLLNSPLFKLDINSFPSVSLIVLVWK